MIRAISNVFVCTTSHNVSKDFKQLKEDVLNQVAISSFRLASHLTEMPCNVHKYIVLTQVVDQMYPTATKVEKTVTKCFLTLGAALSGGAALFTGIPAIVLRQIAISLQKNPWIEEHEQSTGKILSKDLSFSVLFWNICGLGGGCAITDGGVSPIGYRIDAVIDQIVEKNADVNCLCEVFDVEHAIYISKRLKEKGYGHFYYNIHPLPIGVSSGLFVASKYEMKNPEFVRFPVDTLVGVTKNAAKGAFFFDLVSRGKVFATGCTTHMQHSQECQFPTGEETLGKRDQMEIIKEKIKKIAKDRIVFINGDLNGTLAEIKDSDPDWDKVFESGNLFQDIKTTWDGDEFCANLVGKKVSGPLFYDYSMIRKGDPATITTLKIPAGFNAKEFNPRSYSDHDGLWSLIRCKA